MTLQLEELKLDLADPVSIEAKIPQVERTVAEKRREAIAAQDAYETWDALLGRLRSLAGLVVSIEEPTGAFSSISPEAEDAIVRIVEQENRPIMTIGVEEALNAEGHKVESFDAVSATLSAAAESGRITRVGDRTFVPNSYDDPEFVGLIPVMEIVPEAHFGLGGPEPQSKTEAAVRVLVSEPERPWSTPEVGRVMVELGWMNDTESDFASLASTLSRLVGEGKILRPQRGQYMLLPPGEDGA
jgi:hypothetical protein